MALLNTKKDCGEEVNQRSIDSVCSEIINSRGARSWETNAGRRTGKKNRDRAMISANVKHRKSVINNRKLHLNCSFIDEEVHRNAPKQPATEIKPL
jgi:hypothetical protein